MDEHSERRSVEIETELPEVKEPLWKKMWRPALAWQYVIICAFDFMIGPIATMVFFHNDHGSYAAWEPLTTTGAGLYHLSMLAVLGITSWSRGQEKLKDKQ